MRRNKGMGRLGRMFAVALLLVSGSAAARSGDPEQPAKPAPGGSNLSGVTVTPSPKADPLVDPAREFVRQHLPESAFSEQYPRFRDAICVKVQGLPDEFNAFVAKRIVEMAHHVKAPVAAATDCTPNVQVIFTPQPQAQIDDIARRKEILLGFHFQSQVRQITTFDRPVESWYVTRVRDYTGRSHLELSQLFGPDLDGSADKPQGRAGSRLGNEMSSEIVHALILADANKVAGEKIDTVADYISVLALARWKGMDRCNPAVSTILNRMVGGCDPARMPEAATQADLALLTSLYSIDPRESGSMQRATIASALRAADKTR